MKYLQLTVGVICALLSNGPVLAQGSNTFPNIVLILADDMGPGEPSYAGW
ncbi:hypothetical protein ACFL6U_03305 [Planctomycetota bacterium]